MRDNIHYLKKEDIVRKQEELLRTTINYLYQHSRYYRALFDKDKLNVCSVQKIEDLQKIPITKKQDLLKFNKTFFCCDYSGISDIVTTSGSTGLNPIVHPLTQSDLRRLAYNEQMSLAMSNIGTADTVMLSTVLDSSFVAGLAYYLGINKLGASIVRAGAKNKNIQAEILVQYPITTIVGVPSNLIKLSHYCLTQGISTAQLAINKLVLIGEAIRNKDFSLNQLGMRLLECYPKATLFSTYANTETCVSFCECIMGNGGHLQPDLAYIEIVDKNGKQVPDGSTGRLLITTFGCQGMPLLRYDTGDITFSVDEECRCGRMSKRIGPILGRAHNIIKISGITCSQAQLENAVLSASYIDDYCIVVQKDHMDIQQVIIYVSSSEDRRGERRQELKGKIWESVKIAVEIKYCNENELKTIQANSGSRKLIRFLNLS